MRFQRNTLNEKAQGEIPVSFSIIGNSSAIYTFTRILQIIHIAMIDGFFLLGIIENNRG